MTEDEFELVIVRHLAANPEHLSAALRGISSGMERAIDNLREIAGTARNGMTAALVLVDAKRVTPGLRELLCAQVRKAIPGNGSCQAEAEFLKNHMRA